MVGVGLHLGALVHFGWNLDTQRTAKFSREKGANHAVGVDEMKFGQSSRGREGGRSKQSWKEGWASSYKVFNATPQGSDLCL